MTQTTSEASSVNSSAREATGNGGGARQAIPAAAGGVAQAEFDETAADAPSPTPQTHPQGPAGLRGGGRAVRLPEANDDPFGWLESTDLILQRVESAFAHGRERAYGILEHLGHVFYAASRDLHATDEGTAEDARTTATLAARGAGRCEAVLEALAALPHEPPEMCWWPVDLCLLPADDVTWGPRTPLRSRSVRTRVRFLRKAVDDVIRASHRLDEALRDLGEHLYNVEVAIEDLERAANQRNAFVVAAGICGGSQSVTEPFIQVGVALRLVGRMGR
ncbi:MAG: hypothetical protein HY905_03955 [Deltaproteobacteria bacterium]|nr:hypothetical protein [Deltaproteobacteria bacterium]